MKISDEMLLAYVDGELDPTERAEVEAAMAADPAIAQRIDQQRSLRKLLGSAYDPVLHEELPPRLLAAAQAPAKARVVDLAAARKSRATPAEPRSSRWTWQQWGGMAACLVAGVLAGRMGWFSLPGDDITSRGGQLVARGTLAQALSTQLASQQAPDAPVKIGVSFLSRGDEYCRSFTLKAGGSGGLACRRGHDWELRVLAQDKPAADGSLRQAASPIPL
ncbi:MAG TPA: zf-HC2 domain-containing protein, partial [Albitalea sp.]|nr:zf-HC2 domain-containing protein [Albitalea sp.]